MIDQTKLAIFLLIKPMYTSSSRMFDQYLDRCTNHSWITINFIFMYLIWLYIRQKYISQSRRILEIQTLIRYKMDYYT